MNELKETILDEVIQAHNEFIFYRRKLDKLPPGAIEKAITKKLITVEEILEEFERSLRSAVRTYQERNRPTTGLPEIIYKIKNKEGLFSNGGEKPTFGTIGKSWPSYLEVVRQIENVLGQYGDPELYKDCVVVTIQADYVQVEECPVEEFVN